MARISTTEATQALVTTGWAYISLHSADPGTTGASELTGGTYARVAITWNAASGGTVTGPALAAGVSLNIPASTTAAYFGIWSAVTAGTYYIGGALATSVTTGATAAGVITIAQNQITVTAS